MVEKEKVVFTDRKDFIDCDYPIDTEDIIAWKEIVFPELKESE